MLIDLTVFHLQYIFPLKLAHNRQNERPKLLLRKEEEKRQYDLGPLMTGSHQQSSESSIADINTGDSVGGNQELRGAPERLQRGNTVEKVAQDIQKPKK